MADDVLDEISRMACNIHYKYDLVAEKINSLPEAMRKKAFENFMDVAFKHNSVDFLDAGAILRRLRLSEEESESLEIYTIL